MPLLVLPLPTEESVDADVRLGLDRALSALHVGREQHGSPEPIYIVPSDTSSWSEAPLSTWRTRGIVLAGPDDAENPYALALREGLQRACVDVAQRATTGVPSCLTVLVLKPLPHVLEPAEVSEHLEAFARTEEAISAALEELAARQVAGAAWVMPSLRIVPWTWLKVGPLDGELPPSFFGVANDPKRGTFPILHDGSLVAWNPHGMARLEAEMLALHALSASDAITASIFPLGGDLARLYGTHSALVEYPYETLRRRNRLASFVHAADGIGAHAELAAADGSEVDRLAAERVNPTLVEFQKALREPTLTQDHFVFDGAFPHQPRPTFSWEGPDDAHWPGVFDDKSWSIVSPPRRADRLHSDVVHALEGCIDRGVQHVLEKTLTDTRALFNRHVAVLEGSIQGALIASTPHTASPLDVAATALRHTHSRLDALARTAEGSAQSSDDALEALRARRSAWLEAEEELLQQGQRHASRGALYLELVAIGLVGLALALSAWVLLPFAFLGAAVIGAGGLALFFARFRSFRIYVDAWDALMDGYRSEANQTAQTLVEGVEVRVASARRVALGQLAHTVETATRRYTLELRGFRQLLIDEYGRLDRRAAELKNHAARWGPVGHVVVVSRGEAPSEGLHAPQQLREAAANLLKPTIGLTKPPVQLTVGDHLATIAQLVGEDDAVVAADDARRALDNAITTLRSGQWGTRHGKGTLVHNTTILHVIPGAATTSWVDGLASHLDLIHHGTRDREFGHHAVATAAPLEVVILAAFDCYTLAVPPPTHGGDVNDG